MTKLKTENWRKFYELDRILLHLGLYVDLLKQIVGGWLTQKLHFLLCATLKLNSFHSFLFLSLFSVFRKRTFTANQKPPKTSSYPPPISTSSTYHYSPSEYQYHKQSEIRPQRRYHRPKLSCTPRVRKGLTAGWRIGSGISPRLRRFVFVEIDR